MKRLIYLSLMSTFIIFACQSSSETKALSQEELIKKGEYLVMVAGCNDCHTPKNMTPEGPAPDMTRLLSGHPQDAILPELDPVLIGPGKWVHMSEDLTAFAGAWGMTFSANLTPDEQTGIGLWKEENFIQALRTGKHMGMGRAIQPPMPWFNLTHAKDDDLKAMFAYLKSIKPVKNLVPGPIPPDQLGKK
jgi:hypothetical protein